MEVNMLADLLVSHIPFDAEADLNVCMVELRLLPVVPYHALFRSNVFFTNHSDKANLIIIYVAVLSYTFHGTVYGSSSQYI